MGICSTFVDWDGQVIQDCKCVSQAATHGVPIAALPFLAEQQENADKAVGRVSESQLLQTCKD